jgi:hypothetical protein
MRARLQHKISKHTGIWSNLQDRVTRSMRVHDDPISFVSGWNYPPSAEENQAFILNSKNMQDAFPRPSDLKLELPAR